MAGLWKNEIRFFFSRKNCLVLFFGLLTMTGIFWLDYEKEYKGYAESHLYEMQKLAEDVDLWAQRYAYRLKELKRQYPGHEDTEEAELMAKVWADYYDDLKYLIILWQNPEEYEEKIRQIEKRMDDVLFPVYEMGVETGETGIYRRYERQWAKRNLLRAVYEEPLRSNRPDGAYVIGDALKGNSVVGIFLLLMVLALNFDIWAKDFENGTDRLLFTLPYSKTRIYLSRFLIRFALTAAAVFACLLVLFGWGVACHGSGLERFFTVYRPAVDTVSFFAEQTEVFITEDVVVPAGAYLLGELLLMSVYVFFIYSCVQLVSFLGKNQMLVILVSCIGAMFGITSFFLPRESYEAGLNLFAYLWWEKLKEGALGISLWAACILLIAGGLLLLLVSLACLEKEKIYAKFVRHKSQIK